MIATIVSRKHGTDFEELGHRVMMESRDEGLARQRCELDILAFEDDLKPELTSTAAAIEQSKNRAAALCAVLYDRPIPVSDASMLTKRIEAWILLLILIASFAASSIGHTVTCVLIGLGPILSILSGATLTAVLTAIGYQGFDKILRHNRMLEACVIGIAFMLCFWGAFEWASARGSMTERATASAPVQSFVDDGGDSDAAPPDGGVSENRIKQMLGTALGKIMLAADLVVGIFLGLFVKIRTDPDYAAWNELRNLSAALNALDVRRCELIAAVESAKKRCLAGILRAKASQRRGPSYFQVLPMMLFFLLIPAIRADAQEQRRAEGILIDVSGSIGRGRSDKELLQEYRAATKRLLQTEPANTRVWVAVITTDSFGSVRDLLRGWTPDVHGVFTDNLNRARRQLAARFESKSAVLTADAKGTDIIGGLWHLKALMDSSSEKDIWIFSDMINETPEFLMPALVSTGPDSMLETVKSKKLLVPLKGYRIHVVGAVPEGQDPHSWNAIRGFWSAYFRASGATLVCYSAEPYVSRSYGQR